MDKDFTRDGRDITISLVPYYVRAYDAACNLSVLSSVVMLPRTVLLAGDFDGDGAEDDFVAIAPFGRAKCQN